MRISFMIAAFVPLAAGFGGCVSVDVPEQPPKPFVINGQAQSIEFNGSCFVWLADDGRTFVLVQSALVPNAEFDAITTPGTRGRLNLQVRTDLGAPCVAGAIVAEVADILEINDQDQTAFLAEIEAKTAALRASIQAEAATFRTAVQTDAAARIAALEARVDEAADEFQGDVADLKSQVRAAAQTMGDQLEDQVQARLDEFDARIDAKVTEIQARIQEFLDKLHPRAS